MKPKSTLPMIYLGYCALLIVLMTVFNYRGITYYSLVSNNQEQAQKSANHFHK
jgi:hypothetical protein